MSKKQSFELRGNSLRLIHSLTNCCLSVSTRLSSWITAEINPTRKPPHYLKWSLFVNAQFSTVPLLKRAVFEFQFALPLSLSTHYAKSAISLYLREINVKLPVCGYTEDVKLASRDAMRSKSMWTRQWWLLEMNKWSDTLEWGVLHISMSK
jgi:hypothetical protein